jgi:WD40 repeat protein
MTDVFISYARENSDFVRRIFDDLTRRNREAWVDWEDIPLTADWLAEAYAGIEGANAFLFVISPASVRSGPCTLELEHALQSNKRLIPLLRYEVTDPEDLKHMHASLSAHNWVRFRETDDYEQAFQAVLRAIDTDLDHVKAHTRYLVRAAEWDAKGRDKSFLLIGNDLRDAESWLKASETKAPNASTLQQEYILEGRAEANRRRRARTITTLVIVMITVLALVAVFQGIQATNNAAAARAAEATAHYNADQADSSALSAYAQQALYREHNADLAIALSLEANRLDQVPALARTTLAQAAYAPGTRQLFQGYALYPDADMAVTPDGGRVLSVAADESLQLWDFKTRDVLHTWDFGDTSNQRPWTIHINLDGTKALVSLLDGSLFLLNLTTFEQSQPWRYEGFVRNASFSPDGTGALAGYSSGNIVLWNIATGEKTAEYQGIDKDAIYSVATSPDGTQLAAGFDDGSIMLWNFATGEQIRTFAGHTATVRSVAFSPDGTQLLSASDDKTVRLWNVETGEQIYQLLGHTNKVRSAIFGSNGKTAFSTSYDSHIIQWNLETGAIINLYVGHVATVYAAVNMPGDRLLTGSSDGTLRLWDTENGAEIRRFDGHTATVYSVAFTPDGTHALSASQDKSLIVWNLATGEATRTLCCHEDTISGVTISPDATKALSASKDKTLILWDLASGNKIRTFTGHKDWVWSVAFSPDGRTALSGSRDNTLILWDIASGRIIRQFTGHRSSVYGVAISPDGRTALSASSDKTVIFWDIETGQAIRTLTGHNGAVYSVAFSPDGTQALSSSQDLTMILWDLQTGDILRQFRGPIGDITSVAFSNDGHRALSGSLDGSVRLWNLDTGVEILLYGGHTDGVWDVKFSPDNHSILSGGRDKTVRLWRIDTFDELTLWTYANRYILPLSCEQRKVYRIAVQCDAQGVFATSTPYLTSIPTQTSSPSPTEEGAQAIVQPTLTITPSLIPFPTLEIGVPMQGNLEPGSRDLFTFNGKAGQIVTISASADKPANTIHDETTQIEQGLLDTDLIVYAPDGSFLMENDDLADGRTDSRLDGLKLPADGQYVIQLSNASTTKVGGSYTMSVVEGVLPTETPSPTETTQP